MFRNYLLCSWVVLLVLPLFSLTSCGTSSDAVESESEISSYGVGTVQFGTASYYGPGLFGNRTASGKVLRRDDVLAAHRSIRLGTWICVTNLSNNRSLAMPVLDRGPFHYDRILDLSQAAKEMLGMGDLGRIKLVILSRQDDPCGEPSVSQVCQKALKASQESPEVDLLTVSVAPVCPARRVLVELASPDGSVSKAKVSGDLLPEAEGGNLGAQVDFSSLRIEGDFLAARVILIDENGREIYRTGSPVPSPKISRRVDPADDIELPK